MNSETNASHSRTSQTRSFRFLTRSFNRHFIAGLLFTAATLATLLALFYAVEYWRGRRAWNQYASEARARGVKLDWESYLPPEVPEDQNIALTPSFKPLFDFKPGTQQWVDTNKMRNALARNDKLRIVSRGKGYDFNQGSPGRWELCERTDFIALLGTNKSLRSEADKKLMEKAAELNPSLGKYLSEKEEGIAATHALTNQLQAARLVLELVNTAHGAWFAELADAAKKAACRFPIRYDAVPQASILLPHLALMKSAVVGLRLRARAQLGLDQAEAAKEDVLLSLDLADTIRNEPFLISQCVRIACISLNLGPIWEGCATHRWSESQLAAIQAKMERFSLTADMYHTLLGERAGALRQIDQIRHNPRVISQLGYDTDSVNDDDGGLSLSYRLMPSGWFYLEQLTLARVYDSFLLPQNAWLQGSLATDAVIEAWNHSLAPLEGLTSWSAFLEHKLLARMLVPATIGAFNKALIAEVRTRQVQIAMALERYYLTQKQYPKNLEALLHPAYLNKLPLDPFSQKPFQYRLEAPNAYVLYSVGFDFQDDDGTVGVNRNGNCDPRQMDIVWQIKAGVSQ